MKVDTIVNEFILDVTPDMHQVRRNCLKALLKSLLFGADLTVTSLGRNIASLTSEKHQIKRSSRLLGNSHLHHEIPSIYQNMIPKLLSNLKRPIILVDWSDLDARQENFLLRASLVAQGRSLTLLEEVHPLNKKEKPETHRSFIHRLSAILSEGCRPIVVTDAGFRNPWFQLIQSVGWDFVGRIRQRTLCKQPFDNDWYPNKNLHAQATLKAKHLGGFELCRRNSIECELVLFKNKIIGKQHMTAKGNRVRTWQNSRAHAKSRREPWLIATSLSSKQQNFAKKIVMIYSTRMQIEESFRDLKSGLGLRLSKTRRRPQLRTLLLLASLAQYLLFIFGMIAVSKGRNLSYQANSIKKHRVLSLQFIGLRAILDRQLKTRRSDYYSGIKSLEELISESSIF